MALAIFIDATRWPAMRRCWPACAPSRCAVSTDDALLGRFAAAIDSFPDGQRLVEPAAADRRAGSQTLDLKKAGIFRSCTACAAGAARACARHRHAARLDALVAAGRLPAELATDLPTACTS
jgi:hypothetical protein